MKKTTFLATLCLSLNALAFTPTQEKDLKAFSEGHKFTTNLFELEKLGIQKKMLPEKSRPWSGSYWADRAGSIAVRYTNSGLNEGFRILMGTSRSEGQFNRRQKDIVEKIEKMSDEELAKLSPAEKYDLIVGDLDFTFSHELWEKINHNKEHWGAVTMWTGICHGWSPASIHLPRPSKLIHIPILDGKKMLPVYPDDVKALGSFLWANKANYTEQMFTGNRCNQKRPKVDRKTGLVKPLENFTRQENECGDVDPLLFHLITMNRIGIIEKSFVVDVDYNAPVNNHPVAGYEIKYYNVEKKEDAEFKNALIDIKNIKDDVLKDVRDEKTKFVLGVELKLILTHWQQPKRKEIDSVENDTYLDETYIYELDLDEAGNPLKGHWRTSKDGTSGRPHFPDFMWNDFEGYRPREFNRNASRGLEVTLERGLSVGFEKASITNAMNTIKLLNSTRITHKLARRENLSKKAEKLVKEQNMSKEEAANSLEALIDKAGVPKKAPNPHLLSDVVLQLFELAK